MPYKILLAFAISLLALAPANAIRFGANLGVTNGDYESHDINGDVEADTIDFGFVLDTTKAGRLFGYRLNINYLQGEIDDDVNGASDADGLYVNNIFGFRLHEDAISRVWIGPSIFVANVNIDLPGDNADGIGYGIGGSVGIDFKTNSNMDIGFEAGLRTADYHIDTDSDNNNDSIFDLSTFDYDGREIYAKINILFGDR